MTSSYDLGKLPLTALAVYTIGQAITGQVMGVSSDAIIVRLVDGTRGVVHRQDLPLVQRERPCNEIVSRDAEIKAVVKEVNKQKRYLALTDFEVIRDPWRVVQSKLTPKSIVCGEVYNIKHYEVFIQLDEGVPARIPAEEIPNGAPGNLGSILARGDLVEAKVTRIDLKERKITASIQQHLDSLRRIRSETRDKKERETELAESLVKSVTPPMTPSRPQLQGGAGYIRRILIVDDDLHYLNSCGRWLRKAGYEVDTASEGKLGVEQAITQGYDLVLMDANLPDMHGFDAVHQIKSVRPATQVAVVTGNEDFKDRPDPNRLDIAGLVPKLAGFSELERLIVDLESQSRPNPVLPELQSQKVAQEVALLEKADEAARQHQDLQGYLGELLRDLLEATNAETGIVFEMKPGSEEIAIAGRLGVLLQEDRGLSELRYSPVRDVIRDGSVIFDNRVLRSQRKFTYLLSYLMFESCIGIRVPLGARGPSRYALFIFHRDADQFTEAHFGYAFLMARMIGLAVERWTLHEREQELQTFVVAGLLRSGLLHEINNQLNDITFASHNLQDDFGSLKTTPQRVTTDTQFMKDVEASIESIVEASARLRSVANSYLGLLRESQRQMLNVNDILKEAAALVAAETESRIIVKLLPSANLPPVHGIASRLGRAFVNVMLNAIQQIKACCADGGALVVATFCDKRDPERPVSIRVIDTGYGIHRQDFERIFERGVTTRKGGSGLGLFITRGLIESIGGRIYVEDSRMFVGSCFLIKLPAATDMEVAHERAAT